MVEELESTKNKVANEKFAKNLQPIKNGKFQTRNW